MIRHWRFGTGYSALEIRCWRFGTGDFRLFLWLQTSLLKIHAVKPIISLHGENKFLLIISIFVQRSSQYSLFAMQTRYCYITVSFMNTCAAKYPFTFGTERTPTHNFFIFSSEDMHMTTASIYDFDGKPYSQAVTYLRE